MNLTTSCWFLIWWDDWELTFFSKGQNGSSVGLSVSCPYVKSTKNYGFSFNIIAICLNPPNRSYLNGATWIQSRHVTLRREFPFFLGQITLMHSYQTLQRWHSLNTLETAARWVAAVLSVWYRFRALRCYLSQFHQRNSSRSVTSLDRVTVSQFYQVTPIKVTNRFSNLFK